MSTCAGAEGCRDVQTQRECEDSTTWVPVLTNSTTQFSWRDAEHELIAGLVSNDGEKIKNVMDRSEFCGWKELQKHVVLKPNKAYTRNLLQVNEHYALIALVWSGGGVSPIHAHAGSGCWVKVIYGALEECLYQVKEDKLVEQSCTRMDTGSGCGYVDDNVGVHCMRNADSNEVCVSVHLYAPPFDQCAVFYPNGGGELQFQMTHARMEFDSVSEQCRTNLLGNASGLIPGKGLTPA